MPKPSDSSRPERLQLEQELLRRLGEAREAYRAASRDYLKARDDHRGEFDSPDGAYALHKAATQELDAHQEYRHAADAFTNFLLGGPLPNIDDWLHGSRQ
jgi:hypothetical protein